MLAANAALDRFPSVPAWRNDHGVRLAPECGYTAGRAVKRYL
jgi:hypothetical protein